LANKRVRRRNELSKEKQSTETKNGMSFNTQKRQSRIDMSQSIKKDEALFSYAASVLWCLPRKRFIR
jgi:hypothetical protein